MSPDVVSIIRDVAIIVMAIMVTVAAFALFVATLKIYPKIRRASTNFEAASCIMLDTAARLSGLVTAGSEIGAFVWELVNRIRGRGGDQKEDENRPAN